MLQVVMDGLQRTTSIMRCVSLSTCVPGPAADPLHATCRFLDGEIPYVDPRTSIKWLFKHSITKANNVGAKGPARYMTDVSRDRFLAKDIHVLVYPNLSPQQQRDVFE